MIPTAKFIADFYRQAIAHAGHTKKAPLPVPQRGFYHGAPGMARGAQAPADQLWWLVGDLGVRPRLSSAEVKSPTDPDGGNR